jgi:surfactin synthase thioesterase subunit
MEALQNNELLDLMLLTIRADFELCDTYEYHPEPPQVCPVTLYGGLGDREVEAGRLAAWSEMTVGACEVRMFPGDHFYINGLLDLSANLRGRFAAIATAKLTREFPPQ